MRFYLFVCFGVALGLTSPTYADVTGHPTIIDGDTIEIAGQRIRLHGIDAPEGQQTCQKSGKTYSCGTEATFALAAIIEEHSVRCEEKDVDRYGRIVAICYTGPYDINATMVHDGWALAYRRYSTDYVEFEEQAKAAQRGLWSGKFMEPWEWRQGKRLPAIPTTGTVPQPCLIKGNISSKGERIYHVPGGRWYDRTKIDAAKGERWFCSEGQARLEGWRKARS